MFDCYHVLGLYPDPDASKQQIKRAYQQTKKEILLEMECRTTRRQSRPGISSEVAIARLKRLEKAFYVLDHTRERMKLDAHLEKLRWNQYEKFGPSWHRWYFEDRARSWANRRRRHPSEEAEEKEEDIDKEDEEKPTCSQQIGGRKTGRGRGRPAKDVLHKEQKDDIDMEEEQDEEKPMCSQQLGGRKTGRGRGRPAKGVHNKEDKASSMVGKKGKRAKKE